MIGGEGTTYEMVEYFTLVERGEYVEDNKRYNEIYSELTQKERRNIVKCYDTLNEVFKDYPEVKDAIIHLKGAISQTGLHAGGVVISSKNIGEYIPLMKGSDTAVLSVCQTDMEGVMFYKGLKIDVLGLKSLSQIKLCMDLAGIDPSWFDEEDTSDSNVYKFLREGNTCNVFQMHKQTPTRMIKDYRVDDINGLTAVNASNRPGPLAKGSDGESMVDKYSKAVQTGKVIKLDNRIDNILEETKGVLLYQEQCQQLGMVMAGYSLGNADLRIRKVIGKKKVNQIPEIRNEFIYGRKSNKTDGIVTGMSHEKSDFCDGAVNRNFAEDLCRKVFKSMEEFAKYAFNKSHSSAYAFLSYQTAWLSLYYPVHWAVACMTLDANDGDAKEKITATLNSCKKRQIKVHPPDINKSKKGFSIEDSKDGKHEIRYGLLAVKDVGLKVINAIEKMIKIDGDFTSFENFLDRVFDNNETLRNLIGLNDKGKFTNPFSKRNIEPLIKVGAFDNMESNRYKLLNKYMDYRKDKLDRLDESEYKLKDKLNFELDILGFYVSQHPLDNETVFPYMDLDLADDDVKVKVAGIFKNIERCKTKTNKVYYRMTVELKDGKQVKVILFDNVYKNNPESIAGLQGKKAKEGKEIIIVAGKWNSKWGITATSIKRVINRIELDKEESVIPEPNLEFLKEKSSPFDQELLLEAN